MPQNPQQITARDEQTGRDITFMWEGMAPPTEADLAEIFRAAAPPGGFVPTEGAQQAPPGAPPNHPVGGPPSTQYATGVLRGTVDDISEAAKFPFQGYRDLTEIAQAGLNPFDGRKALGAAQDIVRGAGAMLDTHTGFPGMLRPNVERLGAAWQASTEARPAAAAGHLAAGLSPFIGPYVAGNVETAADETKPPYERGYSTGRVLGTGIQTVVPPALRRLPIPAQRPVPMTLGERMPGPLGAFARYIESIMERTAPGSPFFAPLRSRQTTAVIRLADELAGDVAKNASDDVATASRRAHEGMLEGEAAIGAQADGLYTQIREQTAGINVDMESARKVAEPLWNRILDEAEFVDPEQLSAANRQLQRILREDAPQTGGYQAIADARSTLLNLKRNAREPRVGGVASILADEFDRLMMQGAEATGIPGLPAMVRQANALVKEKYAVYGDRFVKRLAEASPEQLPEIISQGNSKQAALAIRAAGDRADDLRRAYDRYLIDRVVTGEAVEQTGSSIMQRIGGLAENVTSESRGINGSALATVMERQHRSGVLGAIHGAQGAADRVALAQSVQRLQGKVGGSFPSLAAGAINMRLGQPILSALGILPGPGLAALPGAARQAAGIAGVSYVLTRESLRTPLVRALKAMEGSNIPQAAFWGSKFEQALLEEQRNLPPQAGNVGPIR